jgi:hypothetical protein
MNARILCVVALCFAAIPAARAQESLASPAAADAGTLPQVLILPGGKKPDTQIMVNPAKIRGAQPVAVTFTVTNNSKNASKYNFLTSQEFDVSVKDTKGAEVWRWSAGRVFANRIGYLSLKQGQSAQFKAVWNGMNAQGQPASPGTYMVMAYLTPDQRSAITGGVVVNPITDPNNIGMPTAGRTETGAVRQIDATPSVFAVTKVTVLP